MNEARFVGPQKAGGMFQFRGGESLRRACLRAVRA
jgi:hypothetical protein